MIKPEDKPICVKCKHFYCMGDTKYNKIWHSHYCRAEKPKQNFNYTLGEWETEEYPYCRDFNSEGNCKLFELECERKTIFSKKKKV